ncbi:hypothetical protein GWI33_022043 [Rhynchophorus ferrugineus]|uniref:Uncharacterized protein n=1 Tax=Rhynchophorus ferrugineus TaxID=354439 RepID=A0A834IQM9_RHYFE|nr:hypothetical protein GWI33_022043 [Rhynchophorus ferrugineus]
MPMDILKVTFLFLFYCWVTEAFPVSDPGKTGKTFNFLGSDGGHKPGGGHHHGGNIYMLITSSTSSRHQCLYL